MSEQAVLEPDVAQANEWRWLGFAAGVVAVAIGLAVVLGIQHRGAAWVAGIGVATLIAGLFFGTREVTGTGIFVIAASSLLTTYEQSQAAELGWSAVYALVCIALLLGCELSFLTRRAGEIAPSTMAGLSVAYLVTAVLALLGVVVVLALMLGLSWPRGFLLVPAVAFAVGSIAMFRLSGSHVKQQASQPPPPSPMLAVTRTPPPPPPTSNAPWERKKRK